MGEAMTLGGEAVFVVQAVESRVVSAMSMCRSMPYCMAEHA